MCTVVRPRAATRAAAMRPGMALSMWVLFACSPPAQLQHTAADEAAAWQRRQTLLRTAKALPQWSEAQLSGLPALGEGTYVVTERMRRDYSAEGWSPLPGLLTSSELAAFQPSLVATGVHSSTTLILDLSQLEL